MTHQLLVLSVLAATTAPVAAAPFALDYRATDPSCIDAARFADEVSAKLGFVPWDGAASAKIRIRVERDGAQFTGTFRNADGNAKVIDGKTCNDVTASLAVTVATAVDATAKPAKPTLTPGPIVAAPAPAPASDDGKIPVTFASLDNRRVDVTVQTAGGVGQASDGTAVVSALFEPVCTTPCTARLPRGRNYLAFSDPDAGAASGDAFLLDRPSAITMKRQSHHQARVVSFLIGAALAALGTYELVNGGDSSILIGTLGLSLGAPTMLLPLYIHDTFSTSQSP